MRKYDKYSLSSSALLAADYRRLTTSSWALIPCIYHFSVNSRKPLPAEKTDSPPSPCSYSEILQLELPYLVAGTVLCLAEPPRPTAGWAAAWLQRDTPPGPRASGGHAHVRSSFPGRRRGGARPGPRCGSRGLCGPGRGEPPGNRRQAPSPSSSDPPSQPSNGPSRGGFPEPHRFWKLPRQPVRSAGNETKENEVYKVPV